MYERGQILIDLAVAQILGSEAISDFQGMRHLAPVIGPVPSNPTVWRALSEAGELRLARVNTAVAAFRRHCARRAAAPPLPQTATEREEQLGRRYQLIAINTKVGQLAWLDARHRSHVHVENDVKQAKDLGLNRWPSRQWAINVARTQIGCALPDVAANLDPGALSECDLRGVAGDPHARLA